MGIKFKDDPDNIKIIKAGTCLVPPGHIPVMNEDAVMVEFTQDTTYTNAEVQAKMKDVSSLNPLRHLRVASRSTQKHRAPRARPRRSGARRRAGRA